MNIKTWPFKSLGKCITYQSPSSSHAICTRVRNLTCLVLNGTMSCCVSFKKTDIFIVENMIFRRHLPHFKAFGDAGTE